MKENRFVDIKPKSLSKNLKALLERDGLTPAHLARLTGIPSMTISRLASGETPDPRLSTLKVIANHFGISIDSLTNESVTPLASNNTAKPIVVPIFDWTDISKSKSIKSIDLEGWKRWQPINISTETEVSENTFALESRPSMYPRFPAGTLFIFDPNEKPVGRDLILVRFKETGEYSIRELVVDHPEWILNSVIPGANSIIYDKKSMNIIAVSMGIMFPRNN